MPVEQVGGPASPATRVAGESCSRHCSVRGGWRGRCSQCAGFEAARLRSVPGRGALHRNDVTGKRMAARAQADVIRFNVPASGCWIKQGAGRGSFATQIDLGVASCLSANSTMQRCPRSGAAWPPGYSPCARRL